MSILIDSHSHIQFPAYDNDREAVIARCREAGIKMIAVGTAMQTSEGAIRVAEQYPANVLGATVGFHPGHALENSYHDANESKEVVREEFDIERLRELSKHPRVVAIGECGLDYYRDQRLETRDQQKKFFIQQIELAYSMQKPLIIHCRSAFPDLTDILISNLRSLISPAGVIHFFSGTIDDARKLLDLGFCLGFGGVITFAREYDEVIRFVPLDRILLETDAPYVAPASFRGKRNEPAHVIEVVKKLAELKGAPLEEVAQQTTQNALSLFGLSLQ